MHECACADVPKSTGANAGQKRASDSLEVDLQVIMIHLKRVLGTELCSASAANALDCYANSPASSKDILL